MAGVTPPTLDSRGCLTTTEDSSVKSSFPTGPPRRRSLVRHSPPPLSSPPLHQPSTRSLFSYKTSTVPSGTRDRLGLSQGRQGPLSRRDLCSSSHPSPVPSSLTLLLLTFPEDSLSVRHRVPPSVCPSSAPLPRQDRGSLRGVVSSRVDPRGPSQDGRTPCGSVRPPRSRWQERGRATGVRGVRW